MPQGLNAQEPSCICGSRRVCVCARVVIVREPCRAPGGVGGALTPRWLSRHFKQSGWQRGGSRSSISKISNATIFPPHAGLNRRYHMTGILSTQQEVALQTVCFALFLRREANRVDGESNRKRNGRRQTHSFHRWNAFAICTCSCV